MLRDAKVFMHYDRVREQGINHEELMEIIAVAAAGNYANTLAEATKIEIDPVIAPMLES